MRLFQSGYEDCRLSVSIGVCFKRVEKMYGISAGTGDRLRIKRVQVKQGLTVLVGIFNIEH